MARSRSQKRRWSPTPAQAIAAAVAGIAVALYALNSLLYEASPASRFGLGFGIAAALLLVGATLYGARRRAVRIASKLRLGTARSWLAFHVYGSLLYLLLVHLHAGFRVPTGAANWWLWALSWWVVLTGLAGRGLQLWIPKALASGPGVEVLYERIPELIDELRSKSEVLVETCDESIQTMYASRIAPHLLTPQRRWIYFVDPTGGKQAAFRDFDYLRTFLPADERERLDRLAGYFETKLHFDAHYTLQGVLRTWLWIHVPASLAVVALFVLHLFSVLYF